MSDFLKGFDKRASVSSGVGRTVVRAGAALKRIGQAGKSVGKSVSHSAKSVSFSAGHAVDKANLSVMKAQHATSALPGKMHAEYEAGKRSGDTFRTIGNSKSESAPKKQLIANFKDQRSKRHSENVKKLHPEVHSRLALPAPEKMNMSDLARKHKYKLVGSGIAAGAIGGAIHSKIKNRNQEKQAFWVGFDKEASSPTANFAGKAIGKVKGMANQVSRNIQARGVKIQRGFRQGEQAALKSTSPSMLRGQPVKTGPHVEAPATPVNRFAGHAKNVAMAGGAMAAGGAIGAGLALRANKPQQG